MLLELQIEQLTAENAELRAKRADLPQVAGRGLRGSNDDFERACLVHIERLQNGLGDYDSAMLDTFCEAVRLVREYNDAMKMKHCIQSPAGGQ